MKIYIDGRYYSKEDAKISVYDHGLLYGDGVFEGIRIYHGTVFRLREHCERLYRSANAILIRIPITIEEMERAVIDTVALNNKKNAYIRLIVTRGVGNLGVNPLTCEKPSIIIIVDDIQLYPEEYYAKGINIITASTRRIASDSLDPRIKSLNYLNNVLAKIEAIQSGCLEAVMLNQNGYISECTGDNISIVTDGTIMTPASHYGALNGITKGAVIALAEKLGIPCRETALTQYDLYTADECFLTGTGAEIMPVVSIDGRLIGNGMPGEITKRLIASFSEEIAAQSG
ncbi:MAG: branched-chain-amino-acid transaminase [Spirochaetes bacterium RBG_13_51_14]|nr:MAG: branched-chain-amino-acid transaminase [Spirochaetes bacterium RBG_13_51_14]